MIPADELKRMRERAEYGVPLDYTDECLVMIQADCIRLLDEVDRLKKENDEWRAAQSILMSAKNGEISLIKKDREEQKRLCKEARANSLRMEHALQDWKVRAETLLDVLREVQKDIYKTAPDTIWTYDNPGMTSCVRIGYAIADYRASLKEPNADE